MEEIFESPVSFEEVEILKTYPVFINVADVDEPEHYFRLDLVDSDVVGPGRFVSPVEILFTPRPHFVISPLQVSGHIERPDNRVVWGNSFMLALYDPTRDTAWTIGSVTGRALFSYDDMFLVKSKSTAVLDKVRRDFTYYVPILFIAKDAAGWHAKFFPQDASGEVPKWTQ
jgi:hypothetical protein